MIPLNISSLRNSKVRFSSTTLLVGNTNSLFPLICALIPYFFKRLVFVRNVFRIKVAMLFVLDNNFMSRRVFMFAICFIFSAFTSIPFISPNDSISVFVASVTKSISEIFDLQLYNFESTISHFHILHEFYLLR